LIDSGIAMSAVLQHLHRRCWAAELGWILISSNGRMLERSLIDVSVATPERIVNEGPPVVLADIPEGTRSLNCDMSRRGAAHAEGDALQCATLDIADDLAHEQRVEAERERMRETSLRTAYKYYEQHTCRAKSAKRSPYRSRSIAIAAFICPYR
jgi:hypothetical protein